MSSEPPEPQSRASPARRPPWLTNRRSLAAAVLVVVVLLAAGTGVLLAQSQSTGGSHAPRLVARATATSTPTATPLPTPTATPKPTATPRPRPTATPKPSGPVNYLVVQIGGCGSPPYPPYPLLFFTNTDPGRYDYLYWYEIAPSTNQFYLRGNEGADISYHHTEQVVVSPNNEPAAGPQTFTVQADRVVGDVDYGPAGYWHGTVYPCK